jgi:acetylornithine deacetylase/succinyl-diaminopimelate desuccinylase-like protein
VVLGPGDIAVAHGADEWVPRADLDWAVETYAAVFARTRQA